MILFFLIGLVVVTVLWDSYVKKNWAKGLSGKLSIQKDALFEGEDNTLTEIIENQNWMPIPVLEVGFQTNKALLFHSMENTTVSDNNYKRDIFSLLGRQRITRHLTLTCSKRGFYEISKIQMNSYAYLFHTQYFEERRSDVSFYVYPKRVDVSQILLGCEGMLGSLSCAKRMYEDPFAFQGIREYTTKDPMKTINWKASAKTGQFMVNTYESTMTEKVMLFLDISDRGIMKQSQLIEELIRIAASLTQRLVKAGMEVGIKINDDESVYLPPKSSGQQEILIEQALAKLEISHTERVPSYETILTDIPSECLAVFLSKDVKKMAECLPKVLQRNQRAIWVYMTEEKNVEIPTVPAGVQVLVTRVAE